MTTKPKLNRCLILKHPSPDDFSEDIFSNKDIISNIIGITNKAIFNTMLNACIENKAYAIFNPINAAIPSIIDKMNFNALLFAFKSLYPHFKT